MQSNRSTKRLIVSTGDISDVDGFLAIARYAQTDADVLFVMNYPAYTQWDTKPLRERGFGQGYEFGVEEFLNAETSNGLKNIFSKNRVAKIKSNSNTDIRHRLLREMTRVGAHVCADAWENATNRKSKQLFFAIGGINDVCPFNLNVVKDELKIYENYEGIIMPGSLDTWTDWDGGTCSVFRLNNDTFQECDEKTWATYDEVYMDFNGSMAFFQNAWKQKIQQWVQGKKIKSMFMMGGVLTTEPPKTLPAIPGVLNRLSCATMNQAYAPAKTQDVLCFFATNKIPIYTVTNNVVTDLRQNGEERGMESAWVQKTNNFLTTSNAFKTIVTNYYKNEAKNKPFDMYTANALFDYLQNPSLHKKLFSTIIYVDDVFGVTLVSKRIIALSHEVISAYVDQITPITQQSDSTIAALNKEIDCLLLIQPRLTFFHSYLLEFELKDGFNPSFTPWWQQKPITPVAHPPLLLP
jgi:hypothetical protein